MKKQIRNMCIKGVDHKLFLRRITKLNVNQICLNYKVHWFNKKMYLQFI